MDIDILVKSIHLQLYDRKVASMHDRKIASNAHIQNLVHACKYNYCVTYRLYKIKIQQTSYKLAFQYSCTEFSYDVQFVIISTEVLTCSYSEYW